MNNKEKFWLIKVAEHPLVDGLPDSDGDGLPDGFDDDGTSDGSFDSESRRNKPWLAGPERSVSEKDYEAAGVYPPLSPQTSDDLAGGKVGPMPGLVNPGMEGLTAEDLGVADPRARGTGVLENAKSVHHKQIADIASEGGLADAITRNYVVRNEVPETVTDPNAPDAGTIVPDSFVSGNEPTVTDPELGQTPSQLPAGTQDEDFWRMNNPLAWALGLGGLGGAGYLGSKLVGGKKKKKDDEDE